MLVEQSAFRPELTASDTLALQGVWVGSRRSGRGGTGRDRSAAARGLIPAVAESGGGSGGHRQLEETGWTRGLGGVEQHFLPFSLSWRASLSCLPYEARAVRHRVCRADEDRFGSLRPCCSQAARALRRRNSRKTSNREMGARRPRAGGSPKPPSARVHETTCASTRARSSCRGGARTRLRRHTKTALLS
jgi:hypothetical protein